MVDDLEFMALFNPERPGGITPGRMPCGAYRDAMTSVTTRE